VKDGFVKPGAPAIDERDSEPLVAHAAYAEAEGGARFEADVSSADDSKLGGKTAKSRARAMPAMPSPF
jgi:hypothetical protein